MKVMKQIIYTYMRWVARLSRFFGGLRDQKEIALEYCRKHPEARASIIAAGRRSEGGEDAQAHQGLHQFTGSAPWAKCIYCGITREMTTSQKCAKYKSPADICAVIKKEEELFEKTLERARKIATTLNMETITGEELAVLHHTHGIDPSMLEVAMVRVFPERLICSYEEYYKEHKATGRRGFKRAILVAR